MDSTQSLNSIPITIASALSPHSLGAFSFDEADEFFWDRKSGRYRYKTGAAKGQFAPREAVLALTRKNLELRSQELVALGDLVSRGEITTRQFQSQAGTLLKRIHLQSAILGSGGVDKMDSADFLRVARTLKTQYYAGKDEETGKRYGLKHLTQELLDGKVSEAQLKARLQMYAQSGNVSYWAAVVKTEQGARPFGVRTLGAAVHCEDCVAYANMPPRPITELPLPGMNCRCRMNCKCSIVPLTLEQAVARGLTAGNATSSQPRAASLQSGLQGGVGGVQGAQTARAGAHDALLVEGEAAVGKAKLRSLDKTLQPSAKLKKLQTEYARLDLEIDRLMDEDMSAAFKSETYQQWNATNKAIEAEKARQRAKAVESMTAIRADLVQMSQEDAMTLASKVKINKTAAKYISETEIREELADFYQLTGGRGSAGLKKITRQDDRAWIAEAGGELNIGGDRSRADLRRILFHETGHFVEVENRAGVGQLAESWVRSRATGAEQKLSLLTGDGGYSAGEKALPDAFIHPYVGKLYGDQTGEVLSMGLEHFVSPEKMLELYESDREHFLLTIGAIRR